MNGLENGKQLLINKQVVKCAHLWSSHKSDWYFETIQPILVFNCDEFAIIKKGIIDTFPHTQNSIVLRLRSLSVTSINGYIME